MSQPIKILIIGNGFGGTYALKNLRNIFYKDRRVNLSLIAEKNYFLFTPLLHEVATGGINPQNIIEPIRKVLGHCLKNFYLGKAEIINLKDRTVKAGNILVPYDYLVLAPGAETNFYDTPGAEQNCLTLKSIDDAVKIKNRAIDAIERASHTVDIAERKKMLNFIIVGGGATGVELASELHELIKDNFPRYYSSEVVKEASVVLIQKGPELLPQFGSKIRKKSLQILLKKGIGVLLNAKVKEVGSDYVLLDNGPKIYAGTIIWVAGIKPASVKFDQTIEKSSDGRLLVNEFLQLKDHKEIFAIGDVASFINKNSNTPLPALAQVAEKEAKAVAKNIQLLIKGRAPETFFYHHSGSLVSLGRWMAIGEMFNFTFLGRITWWIWRTVYLSKLISWRKKVRVALDWTIDIFSGRDISQM